MDCGLPSFRNICKKIILTIIKFHRSYLPIYTMLNAKVVESTDLYEMANDGYDEIFYRKTYFPIYKFYTKMICKKVIEIKSSLLP